MMSDNSYAYLSVCLDLKFPGSRVGYFKTDKFYKHKEYNNNFLTYPNMINTLITFHNYSFPLKNIYQHYKYDSKFT